MSVVDNLKKHLASHFSIIEIVVEDDSERHKGHKQSQGKGGHFKLLIVSDDFIGLSQLTRHRKVYEVLNMKSGDIHALSISAWTSVEWKAKNNVHSG